MSCVRCGKDVQGTVHIFSGGENRRQLLELMMRSPVTLCDKLIPDNELDTWQMQDGEWKGMRTMPTNTEVEEQAKEMLNLLFSSEIQKLK